MTMYSGPATPVGVGATAPSREANVVYALGVQGRHLHPGAARRGMMEGDHHVGHILDALKQLGVDDNTLLVFASDNGPQGETSREMGNEGTPDMGNSGPFRGELGEATEGSIRTFCFVRWPGRVKPGTSSYAMFSIMDFFPTFARVIGATVPADRPIDGVD